MSVDVDVVRRFLNKTDDVLKIDLLKNITETLDEADWISSMNRYYEELEFSDKSAKKKRTTTLTSGSLAIHSIRLKKSSDMLDTFNTFLEIKDFIEYRWSQKIEKDNCCKRDEACGQSSVYCSCIYLFKHFRHRLSHVKVLPDCEASLICDAMIVILSFLNNFELAEEIKKFIKHIGEEPSSKKQILIDLNDSEVQSAIGNIISQFLQNPQEKVSRGKSLPIASVDVFDPELLTISQLIDYADAGNVNAQSYLATCYFEGTRIDEDDEKATKYAELAVKQGDGEGSLILGKIALRNQNYSEAEKHLKNAVAGEKTEAMIILGREYIFGNRLSQNFEKGLSLIEDAVANGSHYGEYVLGLLNFLDLFGPFGGTNETRKWRNAISKEFLNRCDHERGYRLICSASENNIEQAIKFRLYLLDAKRGFIFADDEDLKWISTLDDRFASTILFGKACRCAISKEAIERYYSRAPSEDRFKLTPSESFKLFTDFGKSDKDDAIRLLMESASLGNHDAINKLFWTSKCNPERISLSSFLNLVENINNVPPWVNDLLAQRYYFGVDVEADSEKAISYILLNESSEKVPSWSAYCLTKIHTSKTTEGPNHPERCYRFLDEFAISDSYFIFENDIESWSDFTRYLVAEYILDNEKDSELVKNAEDTLMDLSRCETEGAILCSTMGLAPHDYVKNHCENKIWAIRRETLSGDCPPLFRNLDYYLELADKGSAEEFTTEMLPRLIPEDPESPYESYPMYRVKDVMDLFIDNPLVDNIPLSVFSIDDNGKNAMVRKAALLMGDRFKECGNYRQAIRCYLRAAAPHIVDEIDSENFTFVLDPEAAYKLGYLFWKGKGACKDLDKASLFYKLAQCYDYEDSARKIRQVEKERSSE